MSLFTKVSTSPMRVMGRKMTTNVPTEDAGAGLLTAVGTTFFTYMTADFLSNFLQHPTQKVSSGF